MEQELEKVFVRVASIEEIKVEIKLQSGFELRLQNSEKSVPIWVSFSQKYVFIETNRGESSQALFICEINFELRFQILRKQWIDELTPGTPIGIKFDKNPTKCVQIYSSEQVVEQWRIMLSTKVSQRNFHKLFKAKKKIGKGAFATVYLAQGLVENKLFAVKAFSKEKQFSASNGKEALINEIKILRELNHPNVTKLYGIYETQNSLYMILESLEGGQLNERIKGEKSLGSNHKLMNSHQCRTIIGNLLAALNHLASKQIIHRDIKPQNIMFRRQNSDDLVLCDYGLATHADNHPYLFVRCGTPGFVAPEIINIRDMNSKSTSISDVFSAGLIFHYLLLGHSIFAASKYNEVLIQNRECRFDFNQSKYNNIEPMAKDLLIKMLQIRPQLRLSANEALKHEYFTSAMDIQNQMQRKPLLCIQNILKNKSSNKVEMGKQFLTKRNSVDMKNA